MRCEVLCVVCCVLCVVCCVLCVVCCVSCARCDLQRLREVLEHRIDARVSDKRVTKVAHAAATNNKACILTINYNRKPLTNQLR